MCIIQPLIHTCTHTHPSHLTPCTLSHLFGSPCRHPTTTSAPLVRSSPCPACVLAFGGLERRFEGIGEFERAGEVKWLVVERWVLVGLIGSGEGVGRLRSVLEGVEEELLASLRELGGR